MESKNECILAFDAGGSFLKSALFYGGEIDLSSIDSESANSNGDASDVHSAYSALLTRQKGRAESRGAKIAKVYVDTPGPFDYKNGISMMKHKYVAIYGIQLRPWMWEILGEDVQISFVHDSEAFILGASSEVPQYKRVAGVMLGTGLGFALCIDGEVLRNEMGGPLVSLYSKKYRDGIAEDYISGRAIVNAYNSALGNIAVSNSLQIEKNALEKGDKIARGTYENMGRMLGEVCRQALLEYKIEALLIGGQISRAYPLFGDSLLSALSDISTLKVVQPVKNIDTVHLLGVVKTK